MFPTAQKPQNFSLELIEEDNFHTKVKDTSTLTSLAESTSDKFLKKQTFYQRHSDYFYSTSLTLTLDELTINGPEKLVIPLNDILGATAKPHSQSKNAKNVDTKEKDLWCLNIYLLSRYRQSGLGVSEDAVYKRKYQKLKFVIWSACLAVKWKNLILQACNNPDFLSLCKIYSFDDLPAFKRHFLVFISTKSGRAGAMKSWAKARKLLSKAGCEFTEVFTKYGGHAKDYMKSCDPSLLKDVDGFLSVSGDGGLHEIVNGLLQRPDGESFFHLPFGVIPGGTNNCMDKNLLIRERESVSIKTVCHFIAKGRTIKSDLTLLETENKEKIYNIGIFAWAAFATIDLESNKLRSLGKTRFTLYGIWNVLNMRKYDGRFMYTMSDTNELPDINDEIKSPDWHIRSGPFANLSIHNLPWISTKHRACPSADFQDGLNHALVLGGDHLSRVSLCKALASIKGKKLKQEAPMLSLGNEHYKMKAFRIEPADGKPSLYDIDGEAYKATKIQGKVLEKALTLFCPQYS